MRNKETGGRRSAGGCSPAPTTEKAGSKGVACKVLLVDDEPSILSVLHWALQDLGCHVTSAHGGQAALDKLCKETYDILITDLIMPDLDGFFLLKMGKKLDPEMKVMVMTGSPELVHHIGCSLDGLLVKPFGLNELKSLILAHADIVESEEDHEAEFLTQEL